MSECDKLAANAEARFTVIEFLEWARREGMTLGRYQHIDGYREQQFTPVTRTDDSIIMDFLRIDQQALEQERRVLLSLLQQGSMIAAIPAVATKFDEEEAHGGEEW